MSCTTCSEQGFWFKNETCPQCRETDRKINHETKNSFWYDKWIQERARCFRQGKPPRDGMRSELSIQYLQDSLLDTSSQQETRTTEDISSTNSSPAANKIPEGIPPTIPSPPANKIPEGISPTIPSPAANKIPEGIPPTNSQPEPEPER